ncbi:MAG: hypothetical protein HY951_06250 [Bacteroidia bacterium]|nr:hypothetical protein [Bacteroidia bacterium]
MNSDTKINKFSVIIFITLVLIVFGSNGIIAQPYSVDRPPQNKFAWNFHIKTVFKKNPAKEAERKKQKDLKKSTRNEKKNQKKYWKRVDNPKEKGTNKKVVRRMKKNLRIAERHNHNKHTETKIKRLSRKKIKLPKLSDTKIRWPWKKKANSD